MIIVKYNKEIHLRAKAILKQAEEERKYEKDCLKAGLCAMCGAALKKVEGRVCTKTGNIDIYIKCVNCKYVADTIC